MAFQFGFADDDDDDDDGDDVADSGNGATSHAVPSTATIPAMQHKLEDLLATLPERLAYSTVRIESPLGKVAHVPRRELFDVRVQLLQEGTSNDHVIDQLDGSDIRAGVYEGGYKTWECSLDLASLLLDRGPRGEIDALIRCGQIVELGAGSALPSMILFRHAIANAMLGITFTLADYNEDVVRLVTLPNLLLNWADVTRFKDVGNEPIKSDEASQGELEVTPELLDRFLAELKCKSTTINLLSGSWSSSLADLVPPPVPDLGLVVLAAETIYSPASTKAFVSVLIILLRRAKVAKAMVGAKRIYFGVGGSVDGLKEACKEQGAVAYEIKNHGVPGLERGVGRALIEIQMD